MSARELAFGLALFAAGLLVVLAVLELLAAGFRRMWADRREVEVFRFEVGSCTRADVTSVLRRVWPGGKRDVIVGLGPVVVVLRGEERTRFLAWWSPDSTDSPPQAG